MHSGPRGVMGLKLMRFWHIYATYVHVRLSREVALGKAVLPLTVGQSTRGTRSKGCIYTGIYSSFQAIRAHTVAAEFRNNEHASGQSAFHICPRFIQIV